MKKAILIIDDKPEMRIILRLFLSQDYEVLESGNGIEALRLMQNGKMPDAIITDIQMAGMNGEVFLENLKKSGIYKNIPVMILSGTNSSEEKIKLLKKGASDYMTKPFNPDELKLRLSKLLAEKVEA